MHEDNNLPFIFTPPQATHQAVAHPIIITSPHSGCDYPQDFLDASCLDTHEIRRSEDMFVAELFADAPQLGVPLLAARYPRAYVDLNRAPYELEQALFNEPLPAHIGTPSLRATAGLGTVPRLVAENTPIYNHKLSFDEANQRIETIYKPFHQKLTSHLEGVQSTHGFAVLLDAHSMPSQASRLAHKKETDFILGNRHGRACDTQLTEWVTDFLSQCGWRIAHNKPYAGGYITEQYSARTNGLHALQIEINRTIYMDESNYQKHSGFDRLRTDLQQMVSELVAALPKLKPALLGNKVRQSAAE